MNKTLLVGRAGSDPEVKEFDNGDKIADIVRRVSGVNRVIKVFEYSKYS